MYFSMKRKIINLEKVIIEMKELAEKAGICNSYDYIFYFSFVLGERYRKESSVKYKETMQNLLLLLKLAENKPIKIDTETIKEGDTYNLLKDAIRNALLDADLNFYVCYNLIDKEIEVDWENPETIRRIIKLFPTDIFKSESDLSAKSEYSSKIDNERLIKALTLPYYLQNTCSKQRKMLPVEWVAFIYDLLVIYGYYSERQSKTDKYDSIKKFCTIDKKITKEYVNTQINSKSINIVNYFKEYYIDKHEEDAPEEIKGVIEYIKTLK